MKVAEKIVFLWNDSDGFAATISDTLNPSPSSPLRKLEEQIQLPLDKYGVEGVETGGSIVHFVDENEVYQVSIFLLRSYEPPVLVCAMNELLDLITRGSSTLPTIIAPFFVAASKLKFNNRSLEANNRKASLHYVQVATETETSRLFASRIEKPPLSMQIHYEPLSCLLHLARVKRLPTAILIGQRSNSLTHKALDEELQVIHETGELVASWTGLSFSRDRIKWSASKTSKEEESPWRALYG
ncbi:hypothetical protein AtNW77_Chr3g0163241 [Arabidopsis thaliana]|jgi:hypothetical protein|uniref:At3g07640 n=5 Tax=Arabidopsis TaxID=3701 RepID=Q8L8V4_ARATH|nr:period circadian protein [Arabidopsis thaliana]KAG7624423.1 hypothetical protein ISN45_At03g007620 [Arabidopsis thaliana x Arabidopsis arenosa]KAG7630440.1 hypothetical protein ISN44_As03g007720 [Arabidopsis suecica]AAM67099.1 unknown [Arabidopsis thaliana]ABF83678.1 At3g07640 [Arabidopsis thaliana]AEE74579.1 period circadian protein [Arabidopsis thaliana]|eukprot:NP_566314.1 period circadian protein [Arabidopsis thaliana]